MYHALKQKEILCITFSTDNFPYPSGLSGIALTCKTFLEPALDEIWHNVSHLDKLLRLFPPEATGRQVWEDGRCNSLDLIRPLLPGEWNRFDYYASRIKNLCLDDYREPPLLSQNLKASLHHRSTPILFPKARAITIDGCPSEFPLLLLSPRTNSFSVTFDDDVIQVDESWQRQLVKGIMGSEANFSHLCIPSLSFQDDLPAFATVTTRSLQIIALWESFDWLAIAILGTLSCLHSMTLGGEFVSNPNDPMDTQQPWFPSLREIHANPATLLFILNTIKSGDTLDSVHVSKGSQVEVQQVIDLLGQSFTQIRRLEVMGDFGSVPDATAFSFDLSILSRCSKLVEFRLRRFENIAPPSDEEYAMLIEAWPELRVISFMTSAPPQATLSTIAALSRHCTKLLIVIILVKLPKKLPEDLEFGKLPDLQIFRGDDEWEKDTTFQEWIRTKLGAEDVLF